MKLFAGDSATFIVIQVVEYLFYATPQLLFPLVSASFADNVAYDTSMKLFWHIEKRKTNSSSHLRLGGSGCLDTFQFRPRQFSGMLNIHCTEKTIVRFAAHGPSYSTNVLESFGPSFFAKQSISINPRHCRSLSCHALNYFWASPESVMVIPLFEI